ncbi:MAG: hypothetical protein SNJ63_00230 [Sphingomonadaceae bacterium]
MIAPPSLPLLPPPRLADADARAAFTVFEALVIEQLLRSSRLPGLAGETGLSGQSGEWQHLIDRQQAQLIAAGAPFGLADALARAAEKMP